MTLLGLAVLVGLLLVGLSAGLLPMKAVRLQLGTLLAADPTTLAPAMSANKIALVAAPFTEDENLTISGLTFATFTGSTPLAGAAGAQGTGIDPATGDQIITILAPAGGWRWTCTATPSVAETIYGYALTDNAGAVLLGVATLTTPIQINASGDVIDLGAVELTFVSTPVS